MSDALVLLNDDLDGKDVGVNINEEDNTDGEGVIVDAEDVDATDVKHGTDDVEVKKYEFFEFCDTE